jgi:flagellum-specific ATP synthase
MALYDRASDLIRIGAYKAGTDAELDRAITLQPVIRTLLTQGAEQRASFEATIDDLLQAQPA